MKYAIRVLVLSVALAMLTAACSSSTEDETTTTGEATTTTAGEATTTTAGEGTTTTAGEGTTTTTAVEGPTELNIGMVLLGVQEEPWYSTAIDSIGRLTLAKPHGLQINLEVFENIAYADGERVIRDMASSGKYQMIMAHSTYSDAVAAVKDEFPDILFTYAGSGNDPHGGNAYWTDVWIHEPAYLAGIAAGRMTQTNKISAVASFPFPNVNGPLNAWIEGAKSVNPDIEANVTYIESWFDPAAARDSATAQIAAGSDMVYMERFGPLEAVQESDGVYAFGHFSDQMSFDPERILTGPVALWDPAFLVLIDEWWAHETEGVAYDAPMERIMFFMKDGGSELGAISDSVPDAVQDEIEKVRSEILSGDLVVEFSDAPIE